MLRPSDANQNRRRGRVLVIDDDRVLAETVRRLLERDYEVQVANDGHVALRMIQSDDGFDLILCDLSMAGMSGIALYRRLAVESPHVVGRITFLTGGAFTPEAQAFLDEVPNEQLEKPITFDVLMNFVRKRMDASVH